MDRLPGELGLHAVDDVEVVVVLKVRTKDLCALAFDLLRLSHGVALAVGSSCSAGSSLRIV